MVFAHILYTVNKLIHRGTPASDTFKLMQGGKAYEEYEIHKWNRIQNSSKIKIQILLVQKILNKETISRE